jgi:hypothetical protein
MEEKLVEAIEVLKQKVEQKAKELHDAKKAVNQFCICIGEPAVYDIGENIETEQFSTNLKGHEYYMKPLAGVITNILERHGEKNGPMTVKEIYEQMKTGGFLFETKNDENAMRNIRISMAKNTQTFHKLPTGKFGLLKWFPEAKAKKQAPEKVSLSETPEDAIGPIVERPHQETETPVVVKAIAQTGQPKRRGRPPKNLGQI